MKKSVSPGLAAAVVLIVIIVAAVYGYHKAAPAGGSDVTQDTLNFYKGGGAGKQQNTGRSGAAPGAPATR